MVEYRPVPDADVPEFQRLLRYAFSPTDEYDPIESLDDLPPRATLGDRRGIYEDGELRCTGVHHWFSLRVRGAFREVPGLSAVSTPPQHRRRGFVHRLLAESLVEYRDRGDGFCALWPFSHPFYHRYGWGTCSRRMRATCEPDALAGIGPTNAVGADDDNRDGSADSESSGGSGSAGGSTDGDRRDGGGGGLGGGDPGSTDGTASGEFVSLSADDWAALDRVYRATNTGGLAMDRTEAWWRKRVFTGLDDDPYIAGVSRGGDLAGYLVYDIEEGGADSGRRLVVREYGHVDFEAYRALLEFCRYHDSQVAEIELFGPVDTTIQDLVRDPHEVELAIEPGPMIRIVDVSRALSNLTYPAGLDTDLAIDVADGLADWNDGRFRLSIASGTASCERIAGDGDASDADADVDVDADGGADAAVDAKSDPDLRTSIATLSQVAVGFLPPERAERIDGFDVASPRARETLAAAFEPAATFLREGF
jgi:predicted acetyltransferase